MPGKRNVADLSPEGIPVTPKRLAAAHRLFQAGPEWQAVEDCLDELRLGYPSNTDLRSVLLKASAVNGLYATNVYGIRAMANHVCAVFSSESDASDLELVSRIAELEVGGRPRQFVSFASKYAHYFVDPERFCMLDYYAGQALVVHLGRRRLDQADWTADYPAFVLGVEDLRERDGISASNRELDRYLWLYGCWREHLQGRLTGQELEATFQRHHALLQRAFGS
jgi:hypothetical protein